MLTEISLTENYVSSWTAQDGLRELVQNMLDGETSGFKEEISIKGQNLVLKNYDAALPREALLIGYSTKDGQTSIGQFGEGLKLGLLALLRAGYKVKFFNGGETWHPLITTSSSYNARVLTFDIKKRSGKGLQNKDLTVEIVQGKDLWEESKNIFLFRQKDINSISTRYGDILLDRPGQIFVKGIKVGNFEFTYGYNFNNMKLDRDRKLASPFDLKWEAGVCWNLAVNANPNLSKTIYSLLENQAQDTIINPPKKHELKQEFLSRYGENAYPVDNLGDSRELETLGFKGVVVNSHLMGVLMLHFDPIEKIKEDAVTKNPKLFSWHELAEEERENLKLGEKALKLAIPDYEVMPSLNVVEFPIEKVLGRFKDGEIFLARKILSNLGQTISTIVHEVMHFFNPDGAEHAYTVEEILGQICAKLLKS